MVVPTISCQSPKFLSKEIHYQTAKYNNGQSDCVIDHNGYDKSVRKSPSSKEFRHPICPEISEDCYRSEHLPQDRFITIDGISSCDSHDGNELTSNERISTNSEANRSVEPN